MPAADNVLEVRWHGRGGQGAVSAASLFARIAMREGRFFQAFPEFGAERTGAPIMAFTRVSSEPIELHSPVDQPDVVAVLDESLLREVEVAEGLKSGGIIVTDNSSPTEKLKANFTNFKLYAINAKEISRETMQSLRGKSRGTIVFTNTVILGAVVKTTGIVQLSTATDVIYDWFARGGNVAAATENSRALKRGYDEVMLA